MLWLLLFLAVIVGLALLVHVVVLEPQDLRVTELTVPVEGLGADLEGYTIAVLSDLHHSPGSRRGPIGRAVLVAAEAQPHLVALLGDFAVSWRRMPHASHRWYRAGMEALGPLLRPLAAAPDGVVAVLGNHDYYGRDPDEVRAWLRALGARVLENDAVIVRRGGSALAVAGVPDPTEDAVDERAGCGAVPDHVPRVVLAHHPDSVAHFAADQRVDLVLSGHTHGGQITFPLVGAPVRHARVCGWRTASGWVPNRRARLYVTRGVGTIVPGRLLAPPEVLIVRLTGHPGRARQESRRSPR
ncbi:MAG: metallophosphoesterase [Gemmatimonadaceae bacterium]